MLLKIMFPFFLVLCFLIALAFYYTFFWVSYRCVIFCIKLFFGICLWLFKWAFIPTTLADQIREEFEGRERQA